VSDRRTRVLYLINSLALGGAERQLCEVVRRLPPDRFAPILVSLSAENAYPELLPPDQPRYVVTATGPAALRQVASIVRAERPDIVHSYMEYANLMARLGSLGRPRPVVITSVRSRMMALKYALVEGALSRLSDAVVVNSLGTARELKAIERVPPGKVRVILNILDAERFAPAADGVRERVRAELGLSGPTILVPGRIALAKNQLGLCVALGRLKARGRVPDGATVLLAGRVYDRTVGALMPRLARRYGIEGHLRYLGPVKDIVSLYAAADWILLPSLWEGLPNAAIEAHACARPLLLTADANVDGILEEGVTGHQFPTLSVAGMADALDRAFATPPDRVVEMGLAGRARVLPMFGADRVMGETVRLYDELLARRDGAR
jgi:glycosyltransferase involved in cell wall biosynthesis